MSSENKYRNVTVEKSFTHTNPAPNTEPPFSALRVPEAEQPAQAKSNETSNTDQSNTSADK